MKQMTRDMGLLAWIGVLGGLLSLTAGCVDVVTYSQESRKQGIELYNGGQYADAAGSFRTALRQNPGDYKSHYYLGRSEAALNHYQLSIQAYKAGLDTLKLTLEGREDGAFRKLILDGLADAIAKSDVRGPELDKLQTQVKANPSAETYLLIAKIFRAAQDADSALDAYNRATLTDSRDFEILKEYGLYLEQLGQNQRAEVVLRQAYTVNAKDAEVTAALRRLGVIPGPSIKEQNQLVEPLIPRGPIPQVRLPGQPKDAPRPDGASPTQSPDEGQKVRD